MHLMIDLETLSTAPNAAIMQIGWAKFTMDQRYPIVSGLIQVDLQSCIDKGLRVDWGTVRWWFMQSQEAREAMVQQGVPLSDALNAFVLNVWGDADWEGVWSHGASFDIPILESAFRACGRSAPWKHWLIRDTRTLFELAGYVMHKPVAHQADKDALAQAEAVRAAYLSRPQN